MPGLACVALAGASAIVTSHAFAQDPGTCTVRRAAVEGVAMGGDVVAAPSRHGIFVAGERRTKLVLSRIEETRIRSVRRGNV
ncbi:MAG: hypothetical protein IT379_06465, partial [Deltaproteobacteria bacterium]|nr:hypothetical protein [Deltaproteobacteria bacterium]